MRSTFRSLTLALVFPVGFALAGATLQTIVGSSALGQLPETRLYALFPPGGQAGQTIEVTATSGEDMEDAVNLYFGHPGITATPKMREFAGEQVPVDNTFLVKIDGSVPAGDYEVRLGGFFGASNPRTFVVGTRPEAVETEGNNTFAEADEIVPGTLVNATTNGGADLDYYKFTGKAGQRLIANVQARRIDSKLDPVLEFYDANHRRIGRAHGDERGDAVAELAIPADGEYFLKVYDFAFQGSADYFYRLDLHTGPHVDLILPPAGLPGSNDEYTVYGRNLPGGQPSGVKLGDVELQKIVTRIQLPNEDHVLAFDGIPLGPHEAGVDAISWRLETPQGRSNPRLVYLASAPVVREVEPNDEPKDAQKVTLPVEIAGQFQQRGDVDHVTFDAKAGEVYFVEVHGHRQGGSSADPYFVLERITTNDKGEEQVQRITVQDDYTPNLDNNRLKPTNGTFALGTADPVFRFAVPADGSYRLQVRDRYFENRGDPSLVYRLGIRPATPDFRLVVMPNGPVAQRNQPLNSGALTVRRGENIVVPVLAIKRDGFEGAIELKAEGLPAGVTAKPVVIGPGDVGTHVVLSATTDAPVGFGDGFRIVGTARIEDPVKVRELETAETDLPKRREEVPKLEQTLQKANEELQKAEEALTKSKETATANPDDQNAKNQLNAAQQKFDQVAGPAKAAGEALAAKQKEITDLETRIAEVKRQRDATAKTVTRTGRFATITWTGQQNVAPTTIRLVHGLGLTVLDETAPFQLSTDVERVEVNQGRQVLLPVNLQKRDGFDEQINLTYEGLPKNVNVQTTNANIEKGKDALLMRMFVNNNATVGSYTLYLVGQTQWNYSRNPKRVERLKERQTRLDEMLKAATESRQKAEQAKQAADKAAQEAVNALNAAKQKAQQTEAQVKASPDDDAAKQAFETAKKELVVAEQANEVAVKAKPEAEQQFKEAEAALKSATDTKKQFDTVVQNADNASKPKKLNVFPPSTPIVLIVKPAPVQLSANVPDGGNLKRGGTLEVKVNVKRVNGFEGPVTLVLPALPDVQGLSAAPVTIPADQSEGTITIAAAGDATEGQIPNAVVQATMDFAGQAAVDVPVTIKVSP